MEHLYLNRGIHSITVVVVDSITKRNYCRTVNAISFMVRANVQSWANCIVPGEWKAVVAD